MGTAGQLVQVKQARRPQLQPKKRLAGWLTLQVRPPSELLYWPAAQGSHSDAPTSLLYVPLGLQGRKRVQDSETLANCWGMLLGHVKG